MYQFLGHNSLTRAMYLRIDITVQDKNYYMLVNIPNSYIFQTETKENWPKSSLWLIET